jgi:hypothetical protein
MNCAEGALCIGLEVPEDVSSSRWELEVPNEATRASDCDGTGTLWEDIRGREDCVTSSGSGWAEVGVLLGILILGSVMSLGSSCAPAVLFGKAPPAACSGTCTSAKGIQSFVTGIANQLAMVPVLGNRCF